MCPETVCIMIAACWWRLSVVCGVVCGVRCDETFSLIGIILAILGDFTRYVGASQIILGCFKSLASTNKRSWPFSTAGQTVIGCLFVDTRHLFRAIFSILTPYVPVQKYKSLSYHHNRMYRTYRVACMVPVMTRRRQQTDTKERRKNNNDMTEQIILVATWCGWHVISCYNLKLICFKLLLIITSSSSCEPIGREVFLCNK